MDGESQKFLDVTTGELVAELKRRSPLACLVVLQPSGRQAVQSIYWDGNAIHCLGMAHDAAAYLQQLIAEARTRSTEDE